MVAIFSRTSESLFCNSQDNNKTLCIRKQSYFFRTKTEQYIISDAATFALSDQSTSDAVSGVTTEFFLTAKVADDKAIRLLDVPEQNTGYASRIAEDLRNKKLPLSYQRSEKSKTIILLLSSFIATAVVLFSVFKKTGKD